jgi:hypothetical protein
VFEAMLENATRICESTSGLLVRAENDGFRIAASLRQRADSEEMKHRTFTVHLGDSVLSGNIAIEII